VPETVYSTPPARTSYVRWLLVLWLFVLSAVAYLDRVNISVAGGLIAQEFGFSDVRLGVVFSAFLWGYALFQTPAGWLADRFGPRRVLTAGVLWWGIFSALTALISHSLTNAVLALIAIRFLLGAGEAIIYPSSNQFVSRWIPRDERGIANGIIFAGVGIGGAITPPIITYLMARHGWRFSFWTCALVGLVAGVVWFLAARDNPENHRAVSRAEADLIQQGIRQAGIPQNNSGRLSWWTILSSGTVWILSLAYFCFGYVAWIFIAWFFRYLEKVRGLNLKSSAIYAALPFVAIAICSPLGGAIGDWLAKRFGPRLGRCGVSVLGMGLAAIFLVFGSEAHDARVASLVLAGGAGSLYLSQSAFWAVSADLGKTSAGSVSAFMNMINQFAAALTTIATPFLAEKYGWNTSFRVAAIIVAVGAVAWLFVDPRANLAPSSAARVAPQAFLEQKETA
jgi:MFS transporter, ACS family, glucarate transporter